MVSAASSAWASATTRTLAHAGCSNIQAQTSSHRFAPEPLRLQRKTTPSDLPRHKEQTTDAMGTAVPVSRFRGCSQALLYNPVRPHASLGYKPMVPNVFVPAFAAWPAALMSTGSAGHAGANPVHSMKDDRPRCVGYGLVLLPQGKR
jgi:hypothetical protein